VTEPASVQAQEERLGRDDGTRWRKTVQEMRRFTAQTPLRDDAADVGHDRVTEGLRVLLSDA